MSDPGASRSGARPGARGRVLVWLALALLALPRCGGSREASRPPGTTPEGTARGLFGLVSDQDPQDSLLAELFDPEPAREHRAALLDALQGLAGWREVEVLDVQPLAGQEATAVDLAAHAEGGASATFNVHLRAAEGGRWVVTWFQGPGLEWPPATPRRGDSLTTSLPPELP